MGARVWRRVTYSEESTLSENTIRLQPGDTAPDFTLDSADGTPVTLSEVLK